MGLLQFALGLSKFKGESPKDSYSAKPRENHEVGKNFSTKECAGRKGQFQSHLHTKRTCYQLRP